MDLHVSLVGRTELTAQIYRQIRAAIRDGRLPPGQALPSTRELASRLAVSRNTVAVAYDHLTAEGFLTSRTGAGTYVSGQVRPQQRPIDDGQAKLRPRDVWERQPDPPDMSCEEPEFDFRVGMPDARLFPFATWRALVADQLRASTVGLGAYTDPAGHEGLRAAITKHIAVSRSVVTTVDNVLITNGTQQALDLIARVLIEPGDRVAVEDPGYPPARGVFRLLGANLVSVPVDAAGMDVDRLPAGVRLVYVSPSHQFPLGMPMSLPRRLALLDWAERNDAVIVEDDYDSEFRYTGRPIEPLHSLDHSGRVIYIGSFSKIMLPILRLGFCVVPSSLAAPLRRAKFLLDWHSALPMQGALAQFIEQGLLARHIRRMRGIYRSRRDRIAITLERDFNDWLSPVSTAAGLHLTAQLHAGTDNQARAVVRRARGEGVSLSTISEYVLSAPTAAGIVLGFGLIPTERIGEGLARLHRCFTDL